MQNKLTFDIITNLEHSKSGRELKHHHAYQKPQPPRLPHIKWTKQLMENISPLLEEKQSLTSPFSSWTISTDRRVSLGNSVFKSNFVQRSEGRPPQIYIWDFCMEVNRKAARLMIKGVHTEEDTHSGIPLWTPQRVFLSRLIVFIEHLKRTTSTVWETNMEHFSLCSKLLSHPHGIVWHSKRETNHKNDRI